jgi:putative phage-type endonuclease
MEDKIQFLLDNYGQDDQRTAIWHTKRGQMLTASEIWKTVKDSTTLNRRELILSKLLPRSEPTGNGSAALLWGTRFEPIAKDIYCELNDVDIVDTSCVPHPIHSFLGASPDGIIVSKGERYGNLVEFKCPISRQFDDTTPIPSAYYHQMQLQMECTQLTKCEYIEFQFKKVNYNEWMDSETQYKSAFAVTDTGEVIYRDYMDTNSIASWREHHLRDRDFPVLYWTLSKHRVQLTPHDPSWLPTNLPYFETTWAEIQLHRQNGTLPSDPREKTILAL